LDRLPDDPKLRTQAANILRDVPKGTMVGVGSQSITAIAAAEQAVRRSISTWCGRGS